jgi:hypothetical protein
MAAIVIRRYRLVFRKRKKFDVLLLRSGFVTPLEPHCEPYSVVDIEQGTREIVVHWKFLWDLLRLLPRHGRNGAVLGAYARFFRVASVVSYDNIQGGWDWASSLERPMISVQHGMRQLANDRSDSLVSTNVIFLSWGKLQHDEYIERRTPLPPNSSNLRAPLQTKPVGSLRDSMYRAVNYQGSRQAGRLCLISQFKGLDGHGLTLPTQRQQNIDLLIEHLGRYLEKRDLELIVALYSDRPESRRQEIDWYQEKFGDRCTFNDPSVDFATYKTTDDCEMSFGIHTSVLWEVFGRGQKMLACNYTGDHVFEFPIQGPWYLKGGTYDDFEQRVDWLRSLTIDEFQRLVGDKATYLISYSRELPTHEAIREMIRQQVAEQAGIAVGRSGER